MRKIFVFCLTVIFCLSLAITASAAKPNPFNNRYKDEAAREKQPGVAKNIFVVYDAYHSQKAEPFIIVYYDSSYTQKEITANPDGKVYINFSRPDFFQLTMLKTGDTSYQIIGDVYEDIDAEDIREGEVNYYVLSIDKDMDVAYIYDAD